MGKMTWDAFHVHAVLGELTVMTESAESTVPRGGWRDKGDGWRGGWMDKVVFFRYRDGTGEKREKDRENKV